MQSADEEKACLSKLVEDFAALVSALERRVSRLEGDEDAQEQGRRARKTLSSLDLRRDSKHYPLRLRNLWEIAIAYALVVIVAGLTVLLQAYVPLLTGLVFLWGEILGGIGLNLVAHRLTLRAVKAKGISIEQNPAMRGMLASGDFRSLWAVYAMMVAVGLMLSLASALKGSVWVAVPLLFGTFVLPLAIDAANDLYWIGKIEAEAGASTRQVTS